MPFFADTLVMTSSIERSTLPHVVIVGTLMSIVILHFWGVTLWLEPPVISVRLQLIDLALFSAVPTRPISDLISFQKSYISSIEFLASQGALAWALLPTSHVSRSASLPLYAMVILSTPEGSPKTA